MEKDADVRIPDIPLTLKYRWLLLFVSEHMYDRIETKCRVNVTSIDLEDGLERTQRLAKKLVSLRMFMSICWLLEYANPPGTLTNLSLLYHQFKQTF